MANKRNKSKIIFFLGGGGEQKNLQFYNFFRINFVVGISCQQIWFWDKITRSNDHRIDKSVKINLPYLKNPGNDRRTYIHILLKLFQSDT